MKRQLEAGEYVLSVKQSQVVCQNCYRWALLIAHLSLSLSFSSHGINSLVDAINDASARIDLLFSNT